MKLCKLAKGVFTEDCTKTKVNKQSLLKFASFHIFQFTIWHFNISKLYSRQSYHFQPSISCFISHVPVTNLNSTSLFGDSHQFVVEAKTSGMSQKLDVQNFQQVTLVGEKQVRKKSFWLSQEKLIRSLFTQQGSHMTAQKYNNEKFIPFLPDFCRKIGKVSSLTWKLLLSWWRKSFSCSLSRTQCKARSGSVNTIFRRQRNKI